MFSPLVIHCSKKWSCNCCITQGWTNPGRLHFFTLAPSPCGSSVWSFLHVALLAARIFGLFINFWKIGRPSIYVCPETRSFRDIPTGTGLSSFLCNMSCLHIYTCHELLPMACSDLTAILFGVSNITANLVRKLSFRNSYSKRIELLLSFHWVSTVILCNLKLAP